jgi:hypothetical protein
MDESMQRAHANLMNQSHTKTYPKTEAIIYKAVGLILNEKDTSNTNNTVSNDNSTKKRKVKAKTVMVAAKKGGQKT